MSKIDEKVAELQSSLGLDAETTKVLGEIELQTMEYTLADAIREGSSVTDQAYNWGNGENACALSAAVIAGKARGYIE
jgi:hypothetical protein